MIGSMIVGFLIGLIASAISNRGERMGCIGKTFVGWLGAFVGQLLFGKSVLPCALCFAVGRDVLGEQKILPEASSGIKE